MAAFDLVYTNNIGIDPFFLTPIEAFFHIFLCFWNFFHFFIFNYKEKRIWCR